MNQASAVIIASSTAGDAAVASAARISTTQGSALEIFQKSLEKENNGSLIEKVVGSGHTSTLEHQFFTIAFDQVSVCTEEFVIEFRLGSYTVKSRRYVDFSNAGFYIPPMPESLLPDYRAHMQGLFSAYAALIERDIPKEDARYLLPYCFRSNFYCTMNARELLYMIAVMCKGRGASDPELKMLGESLKTQLRAYFPNLPELIERRFQADPPAAQQTTEIPDPLVRQAQAVLQQLMPESPQILFPQEDIRPLLLSERPRELELMHIQFRISDLSLAAITHLVRHRVQTVLVPKIAQALTKNTYVLPESIRNDEEANSVYQRAFSENAQMLRKMLAAGLPQEAVQYFALAGNQLDVFCDMNGRELLHFMKLRTCSRAQWEIRACAIELLRQLRERTPELFRAFGPGCYVTGRCPEGRLSCGKMDEVTKYFSAL